MNLKGPAQISETLSTKLTTTRIRLPQSLPCQPPLLSHLVSLARQAATAGARRRASPPNLRGPAATDGGDAATQTQEELPLEEPGGRAIADADFLEKLHRPPPLGASRRGPHPILHKPATDALLRRSPSPSYGDVSEALLHSSPQLVLTTSPSYGPPPDGRRGLTCNNCLF